MILTSRVQASRHVVFFDQHLYYKIVNYTHARLFYITFCGQQ